MDGLSLYVSTRGTTYLNNSNTKKKTKTNTEFPQLNVKSDDQAKEEQNLQLNVKLDNQAKRKNAEK